MYDEPTRRVCATAFARSRCRSPRMITHGKLRYGLIALVAITVSVPLACSEESVTPVPVASVEVSPDQATLYVGQTASFSAEARDASGTALPDRSIGWSSDNPDVASVDGSGLVEALAPGTATISATSEGLTGTAAVTVLAGATIVLGDTAVTLGGQAGRPSDGRTILVTHEGEEPVTDLSVAVSYPEDAPDGWLQAALEDTSTPTNLLLQASAAELSAGAYQATVELASPAASNSPRTLSVTFEVVEEVDPGPDAGTSSIEAEPRTIVADGGSTSKITVTLRNSAGALLEQGGDSVTLATTGGTLSKVNDEGDGSYTATLTSAITPATAIITGTVNGDTIQDEATVVFTIGGPSGAESTIEAEYNTIVADGNSTSTITVTVRDANGNIRTQGGDDVVLHVEPEDAADLLSELTDQANGTYTATLTSSATPQTLTITGTVNGQPIEDDATVEFTVGGPSAAQSTIEADSTKLIANGSSTATITVTLKDAEGNQLTDGGADVDLDVTPEQGAGELSGHVIDNGDGTYTDTLTAPTTPATATITGTVNGDSIHAEVTVVFTAGPPSAAKSTIEAKPTSIVADGSSQSMITVRLRDAQGNPVTDSADVHLDWTPHSAGTLSEAMHKDSTYTATFTASTHPGTVTITGTINGEAIANDAKVELTPPEPSPATSTIKAQYHTLVADGSSINTITVTLKDADGDSLRQGDDDVALQLDPWEFAQPEVHDNKDGTYTAQVTSPTSPRTVIVAGTVNGETIVDQDTIEYTVGGPSATESTIEAAPDTINFGGSSTITVRLLDAYGHVLTEAGHTVRLKASEGMVSSPAQYSEDEGAYISYFTAPLLVLNNPVIITGTIDGGAGTEDGVDIEDDAKIWVELITSTAVGSMSETHPAALVADSVRASAVPVTLRQAERDASPTSSPVLVPRQSPAGA